LGLKFKPFLFIIEFIGEILLIILGLAMEGLLAAG
jgi:hypothetical protein